MVEQTETDIAFECHCTQAPAINDRLMEQMPAHRIVITATGMGKDTPRIPISNTGKLPEHGIAWELARRVGFPAPGKSSGSRTSLHG